MSKIEMSTVEILRAARKKIEKPEMWKQGGGTGHRGECCAWIAMPEVPGRFDAAAYLNAALGYPGRDGLCYIFQFNDNHTHSEVLALFDKAIALAESESGALK